MKKVKVFLLFIFLFLTAFFLKAHFLTEKNVFADSTSDQITQINQQIKEYEDQIAMLQNQASTLSNQISQYDVQIKLLNLQIQQTQDKINLLGGRIDQLGSSLSSLNDAFSKRVVQTYKMSRLNEPYLLILSSNDISDAVSSYHYLKRIESADRDLMVKLADVQGQYQGQKKTQVDLQTSLQKQQNALNSQKIAKAKLLTETKNNETKYQQLLSQAKAELAAISRFVTGQGGASILQNQTVCDGWGCYYNQRDSKWGLMAMGSSNLSVAEFGCLVSSSAMVATFYKRNLTPADIASDSSAFFSPDSSTALLWNDITVNGVHIVRTRLGVNTASIDGELAAGRPVIVGLYSGPAHFIVLKSGSNGNYIMNDPFMENGHDVSFTSKYSVSIITDVERVSVN